MQYYPISKYKYRYYFCWNSRDHMGIMFCYHVLFAPYVQVIPRTENTYHVWLCNTRKQMQFLGEARSFLGGSRHTSLPKAQRGAFQISLISVSHTGRVDLVSFETTNRIASRVLRTRTEVKCLVCHNIEVDNWFFRIRITQDSRELRSKNVFVFHVTALDSWAI